MKKRPQKSKIFNSVNIILTALLFVELVFMANWAATGNQVKMISVQEAVKGGSVAKTTTSTTTNKAPQKFLVQNFP